MSVALEYLADRGQGIPYGSPGWVLVEMDTHLRDKHNQKDHGRRMAKGRNLLAENGLDIAALAEIVREGNARTRAGGYDDRGPDDALAIIANKQGFDRPPKVVSRKQLDARIAAGDLELFRAVKPSGEMSAQDLAEQFRSGPAYYGRGEWANGIHATANVDRVAKYGPPEGTVRMALRADARTATIEQLRALRRTRQDHTNWPRDDIELFQDLGRFAAALGYDAIEPDDDPRSPWILLNRSALYVEAASEVRRPVTAAVDPPPRVEGLTPEELEEQGAAVEAVVAAALALVAEQAAASVLAGIPAVIGTGLPAYPWVSLDDVAIVPTLWLRRLDEQVMPAVRAVFDQTAEHVHEQIQAAVDANPGLYGTPEFDLPGEVVEPPPVPDIPDVTAEQLMAAARNRLVGIGDTLWADIRQQIVEGIGVGESIEQLGKRIEATAGVAEPRARTIARTEVVSTSNGAAIAQARSAGVPMTKSWLDTHDTRTRPTHKEAGRTQRRIPLDQPFEVGGFQLDFPGDPSGPPQEVINERCAIGFELGVPEPVVAAVGRKTAADPYVRDSEGKFAETASAPSKLLTDLLAIPFAPSVEGEIGDSVRAAYSGKFAGFTVDSVSVRVRDGGAGIVGLVKDADGNTVGTVMRTLDLQDDDTVWAGHRYMQLDENLRGQGFAEAYNAHLIDWYRDNGVSAVELKAASSVGGYAHARAGYDWRDSKAAEGVVDRVRDAADPSRPRYSLQPAGGNMDRVPVERLPEQRRLAQEMVARFEGTRFGSDDYPTPFEVSQLGRWPGAGKDDMWVGKAIMLGSSWDGVKIL